MDDIILKYIEIGVSIFIYVSAAAVTVTLLALCQNPIIEQGEDKTFATSQGVQYWEDYDIYGRDLLLMLFNTDPMSPFPRAIKINNTPVIKLDKSFVADKMKNVSEIYSSQGQYRLSTMLDWKVVEEKYVYDGADAPYIHYVLEEVQP